MADITKVASSRSALLGASGLVIPSGATVTTLGFLTEGDGGGGLYKEVSAPATELQANKGYIHIAGDRWLKLVPENGEVRIEQFGGRADYPGSGTSGTDNYGPLTQAIAITSGAELGNTWINLAPNRIRFGAGRYKFSQTLKLHNIVNICGTFVGPDMSGPGYATQFWFTNTTGSAFVFFSGNTGPGESDGDYTVDGVYTPGIMHSAGGSYLGGFSIYGIWDRVTDLDQAEPFKAALRVRAGGICIERIGIHSYQGHGLFAHGAMSANNEFPFRGNTNQCTFRDIWVHSCAGHAYWVAGNDANASTFVNIQAENAGGCGIYDAAALGGAWHGGKIATYGRGVHKDGKAYQYLGPPNASGPNSPVSVVPGTNNDIWYYVMDSGPNVNYPDWDTMTTLQKSQYWLIKCPIYIANTFSSVSGIYNELGPVQCHTLSPYILGGIVAWTKHSANQTGIQYRADFTNTSGPAFDQNGGAVYVKYGGPLATEYVDRSMRVFSTGRSRDGDGREVDFGYQGDDLVLTTGIVPLNKELLRITTPSTRTTLSGTAPRPDEIAINSPFIKGHQSNNYGKISFCDGTPTAPGVYTRRDRFFYENPVPGGAEGVVVTTSGAIHEYTWVSGTYGVAYFKNSTNRVYRHLSYGTSTIQPTHTSGTQTLADGEIWQWIADGPPTFKTFGSISL